MTDESPKSRSGYPSRRSLRTAAHAATAEELSFRLPRRTHVPGDTPAVSPRAPRTLKQKLAATAGVLSVSGLALVAVLPIAAEPSAAEAVAGQQQLFSEVSMADLPDSFADVAAVDSKELSVASYTLNPKVLVNYPFSHPVTLTDPFGYRVVPVEQFHDAQDFAAAAGTPIRVIADGVVLEAGYASDGCGFGLKVEHQIEDLTVTSRYCHMMNDSHSISVGDELKMGDFAGSVGNTGLSFGPHLHLAIRVNDVPVDPMPFLAQYNTTPREKPQLSEATKRALEIHARNR